MFKEYRQKRNMSQEQLAELVGISTRQIQRIENDEAEPSLKTIKKLIYILKIEDKDILNFMKNPELEKDIVHM